MKPERSASPGCISQDATLPCSLHDLAHSGFTYGASDLDLAQCNVHKQPDEECTQSNDKHRLPVDAQRLNVHVVLARSSLVPPLVASDDTTIVRITFFCSLRFSSMRSCARLHATRWMAG